MQRARKARQVPLAQPVPLVRKAHRVFPAWRVLVVPRVPPARRGRRVPAEPRATLVRPARRVWRVPPELRVQRGRKD